MTRPARRSPGSAGNNRPHHPFDQAEGMRQMFASRVLRFVPVVSNSQSGCGGLVLERLCAAYASFGMNTLVVDASDQARMPSELVAFDLSEGIEPLSAQVSYMPARGLPLRHVDARGSCSGLLHALADASPSSDVVLVHASAIEIARLFGQAGQGHALRPLIFTNDLAEGLKEAYASVKTLYQRVGWGSYDLMVCAVLESAQADQIATRMAKCAESFLGVVQRTACQLDPHQEPSVNPDPNFMAMAAALLHGALPLSLGEAAFEHLTSPGAALPARAAWAHN